MTYQKDINELQESAVKWWPEELKKKTASISVIPTLLDSQEDFIAILKLCDKEPLQAFDLIKAAKFPANLFLKHLTVLADYGGETIQRLNKNFADVFDYEDKNEPFMKSLFRGQEFIYKFQALPVKGRLNNKKMKIDGKSISTPCELNPIIKDMIAILLHGSAAINSTGADLEKCEIGGLLGHEDLLQDYVQQKYILVSRITGGATSNTQGQLAQSVVCDYLRQSLDKSYKVTRNGNIALDSYEKTSGMPFDIVIEKNNKFVGVEVSFQVTTNSVIERKAGQAQERQNWMHEMGYKIAYVIDGAGNFQRRSAVSRLCDYSDCTVAYSEKEFDILVEFIKSVI